MGYWIVGLRARPGAGLACLVLGQGGVSRSSVGPSESIGQCFGHPEGGDIVTLHEYQKEQALAIQKGKIGADTPLVFDMHQQAGGRGQEGAA